MGWIVLFTLLLCMAASAVSVYPGEQASRISRGLCAASICLMAGTGLWMLVGRPEAFSDFMMLPSGTFDRAALAVGGSAALGILFSLLWNHWRRGR